MNPAAQRTQGKTASPPPQELRRVLLVDDSASLRQKVGHALRDAGYDTIEAHDGRDALGKLDQLQGSRIHLVICDVNMPNMDGISFVREMKKRAEYRYTPVIMLTTVSKEEKKFEGQLAGAKAWVVKPFRPAQLLTAVSKLILP